jgi:serine phosphatase RsbU (regulator of sigma subunit)
MLKRILLATLTFLCLHIYAQKDNILTGIVVDENDQPLAYALVVAPDEKISVTAGDNGTFALPLSKRKEPAAINAFLKDYKAKRWFYDSENHSIKVVMDKGNILAGTLIDSYQEPMVNTVIKIKGYKTNKKFKTDKYGYFKIMLPEDAQINTSLEFLVKDKVLDASHYEFNALNNFIKAIYSGMLKDKKEANTTIRTLLFYNSSGKPLTETEVNIDGKFFKTNSKGILSLNDKINTRTELKLSNYDIIRSEYYADEEQLSIYVNSKKTASVVAREQNDMIEDAKPQNINDELHGLISALEREKSLIVNNNDMVSKEVQRIKERLAQGEELTPELREKYRQDLITIKRYIDEIAELHKKSAESRSQEMIFELQSLLLEKDSLNKLAQLKLLKEKENNDAVRKGYVKQIGYLSLVIVLLLGLAVVFYFLNIRIKKQKNQLTIVNDQLEQSKQDLISQKEKIDLLYLEQTDSIKTAQVNQLAILPPDSFLNTHLPKHFVLYKPKDIVSGDFYWCEIKGDNLYIAAVDCTGHGVAGALTSMLGYHSLKQALQSSEDPSPAQILNKLNEEIIHSLRQDTENALSRDGMDVSICKISLKTSKVSFAGAGNPLYIARNNEIIKIDSDKQSIGFSKFKKGNLLFTDHEVEVQKGDILYLFSDGYAGQLGGENGMQKFMYNRFREILLANYTKPMEQQKQALETALVNWIGTSSEQTDDITVIGFSV